MLKLAEQRALVRSLLALKEQLQGSVFSRYGACGKESCACQKGALHGPYYVLSGARQGTGFSYIDARQAEDARRLVGRYREFRSGLKRLRLTNADLVALLKQYQRQTARRGVARLGVAS